jgi:hypothetical protein
VYIPEKCLTENTNAEDKTTDSDEQGTDTKANLGSSASSSSKTSTGETVSGSSNTARQATTGTRVNADLAGNNATGSGETDDTPQGLLNRTR